MIAENKIQWEVIKSILDGKQFFDINKYFDIDDKFIVDPENPDAEINLTEGMSRDNTISFVAYCRKYKIPYMKRLIKNFELKKHIWPFEDLLYYLTGIVSLPHKWSCLKIKQHNDIELDTDGKLLYFIRTWGNTSKVDNELRYRVFQYVVIHGSPREQDLLRSCPRIWTWIFSQYFTPEHEISQLAKDKCI